MRRLAVVLLLTAAILAGVVSFYASASPDGLERVATDRGFAGTAGDHALAEGPLADYRTSGVEGDRLSGGVAGLAGVAVVLLLTSGLVHVVRRRQPESAGGD